MTPQRACLPARLQRLLEHIYDIDAGYSVSDFVITDRRQAAVLDSGGRVNHEKLLIAPTPAGVDVSLFLDEDILAKLEHADPFVALTDHNLAEFCAVLEGVSHFTYVAWNAGYDKRVTLLELELQAEVDKFVAAMVLLKRQNPRRARCRIPEALCRQLFEKIRLVDDLDAAEFDRYRHANRYARQYCLRLAERLRVGARALSELRRFYRQPKLGKLHRIRPAIAG